MPTETDSFRSTFLTSLKWLIPALVVFAFGVEIAAIVIKKPFWGDEWFVFSSYKFRDIAQFFGVLDYGQQFPRVYLAVLKIITTQFDHSYLSLRTVIFVTQIANILVLWFVIKDKVFPQDQAKALLIVLMFLTMNTTYVYFLSFKQYSMEFFFSLVAFWQFQVLRGGKGETRRADYILACLSFVVGPFFSYTYPIVAGPVFLFLIADLLDRPQRKPNFTSVGFLLF